jgi:hypothetical protein
MLNKVVLSTMGLACFLSFAHRVYAVSECAKLYEVDLQICREELNDCLSGAVPPPVGESCYQQDVACDQYSLLQEEECATGTGSPPGEASLQLGVTPMLPAFSENARPRLATTRDAHFIAKLNKPQPIALSF